ncbi:nitroreductase family protein [Chloroflexota bacterium]
MNYDSLLDLVKQRRSCRIFKPAPIPDEYIDKIIEVARWAPSGANTQPWEFIVIREVEVKQKIARFIEEHRTLTHKMDLTRDPTRTTRPNPVDLDAPVLIILCGDPRTIEAYPVYTVYQRGQSNLDSSLASAFLYMHLAATTLGLGSRWISATRNFYIQCLIKNLLGIPKELEIYDTMAFGYPDSEPRPRLVRAKEEMVHYDLYDTTKFRTDEDVKAFISSFSNL